MVKEGRAQKATFSFKSTFVMVSICVFVAIMAIYDENSSELGSRKPYILASLPSSFDIRVLPSYRTADFNST